MKILSIADARPRAAPSSDRGRFVPMLACGAVALIAFVSRRPDQWFGPQFWGEDGKIFFFEAATLGGRAFFETELGYLLLVARVVAGLAAVLPWEYVPAVYMISSAAIAAAVVVRLAFAALPPLVRGVGAAALVAVPHSGEVFLNLANLHWILGALLMVNLLEEPPTTRGAATQRSLEVFVAGLSGPVALCLAPFALWWMWRVRRQRLGWPLAAAWLVAIMVQASLWLASSRGTSIDLAMLVTAPAWLLPRYAAALFVGGWASYTPVLGWAVAGIAVIVFGAFFLERAQPRRSEAAWLLATAVILLAAGRVASGWWANPVAGAARYAYLPLVFIVWALAWLAAGTTRPALRTAALGLCCCVAVSALAMWQANPMPRRTNWTQQVREARAGQRNAFEIPPDWTFPVPGSRPESTRAGGSVPR